MDGKQFDGLTRVLGRRASRRRGLAAVGALAVAGVVGRSAAAQVTVGGRFCGGIAGIPCPDGLRCVIDTSVCDPARGGADCGGWCRPWAPSAPPPTDPCAAMLCLSGTTCCPNCGGTCVPQGTACSDQLCGERCGKGFCGRGEVCCNDSCGICTPPDGFCTMQYCGEEMPAL